MLELPISEQSNKIRIEQSRNKQVMRSKRSVDPLWSFNNNETKQSHTIPSQNICITDQTLALFTTNVAGTKQI